MEFKFHQLMTREIRPALDDFSQESFFTTKELDSVQKGRFIVANMPGWGRGRESFYKLYEQVWTSTMFNQQYHAKRW